MSAAAQQELQFKQKQEPAADQNAKAKQNHAPLPQRGRLQAQGYIVPVAPAQGESGSDRDVETIPDDDHGYEEPDEIAKRRVGSSRKAKPEKTQRGHKQVHQATRRQNPPEAKGAITFAVQEYEGNTECLVSKQQAGAAVTNHLVKDVNENPVEGGDRGQHGEVG